MSKQCQESLPESFSELMEMVEKLQQELEGSERENKILHEELRLLRLKRFGRTSERFTAETESVQRLLFDIQEEAKFAVKKEKPEETKGIVIAEHKRKKPGRKPLAEDLPRVEVTHDIAEEDKKCACGSTKNRIGEETSEQLRIEPARLWVERHIRPKYACKSCEGVESEDKVVKIAPPPVQMIPKSFASPSLLAHIMIGKFCDALPFYRQEQQFKRYGIDLPRATMCNWAMKVAARLKPLLEMLRLEVLMSQVVNVDESTIQVLDEPGREPENKSYMWAFRGGGAGDVAQVFQYAPSRSGKVAQEFLTGYEGYVQTDGYKGYDFIDDEEKMIHAGCWAHARRKFYEVIQAAGEKSDGDSKAGQALKTIRELYLIEREAVNLKLDEEQIYKLRQEKSKPIVMGFHEWLLENAPKAPPKSLLGKAFNYALSQWPRLVRYLEDGVLKMDNNLVENAIRPFVVGRKNWLFSQTPEGAHASATFYSLIETAKANGLDPYKYLQYLFEKYPHAKTPEDIFNLLPMSYLKIEIASVAGKADLENMLIAPK